MRGTRSWTTKALAVAGGLLVLAALVSSVLSVRASWRAASQPAFTKAAGSNPQVSISLPLVPHFPGWRYVLTVSRQGGRNSLSINAGVGTL